MLVLGLGALARNAGVQNDNSVSLPGTGSQNATDVLTSRFPSQANGTNPLVLGSHNGKLTDAKNKQAINSTVTALRNSSQVTKAVSPLTQAGAAQLSKDKTIGYINLTLAEGASDLTLPDARGVVDLADPARNAGLEVAAGGYLGQTVSKPNTHSSEVIGITAAIIVLLFAFGTVVAMGMPITTAILGLVTGLSLITLLGHVISVPSAAPILATMMGLGVGIDYSLFIVTRHRAHIRAGYDIPESIARATATAGGAVLFAGSTVVIALLSLSLVGIPIVSSLGYTAAIVVAVAVLAALTLLPALLALVGPRIDSLRVPFGRHEHHDEKPHGWLRWAEGVAKRPVPAMLAAVAALGVLAIPLLSLNLGQADNSVEPKSSDVRRSYDLLTEGFGVGANGPLLISVDLSKPAKPDQQKLNQVSQQQAQLQQEQAAEEAQAAQVAQTTGVAPGPSQAQAQLQAQSKQLAAEEKQLDTPASDPRLVKLRKQMEQTGGVKSVTPPPVNKQGTAAIYNVQPTTSPSSQQTVNLVTKFRDNVIPDATQGQQMTAYVGGSTAGYIDLADEISNKLPHVILIVVGLSIVILLLGFRSIVVPIESALMNLLSVAAAYGVVTFVFQEGHGAKLIGLPHAIPIVSFLPLMMFAILFGLSMDYQVFLLTQITEKHKAGADNRTAVIEGLASSGRVITSAALIMVSVFASFILNPDPTTKQFGVGLAVAIAIDATIVRCLLVPAIMVLVGRTNWWLPGWLDRVLPRVSVEGDEYFAAREGAPGR